MDIDIIFILYFRPSTFHFMYRIVSLDYKGENCFLDCFIITCSIMVHCTHTNDDRNVLLYKKASGYVCSKQTMSSIFGILIIQKNNRINHIHCDSKIGQITFYI